MRKDITQEDEHYKVLSMLVLEQTSFLLAVKDVSQTRMKLPFHHFVK